MKKLFALCLFVGSLAMGCTLDQGDGGSTGYPITFQVFNISPSLSGAAIQVDVYEETSPGVSVQTGQIVSTVTGTSFTGNVKEYSLGGGIGTTDTLYQGEVVLSFNVYLDMDGDGQWNTYNLDVADGINNQNIPFTEETLYSVNFTALHKSGT